MAPAAREAGFGRRIGTWEWEGGDRRERVGVAVCNNSQWPPAWLPATDDCDKQFSASITG